MNFTDFTALALRVLKASGVWFAGGWILMLIDFFQGWCSKPGYYKWNWTINIVLSLVLAAIGAVLEIRKIRREPRG